MSEFKSWQSYGLFANVVVRRNRYIYNSEVEFFLKAVAETSEKRIKVIKSGVALWRAQLGCDYRPFEENGEILFDEQVPYSEDRMNPLPDRANEARTNPIGRSLAVTPPATRRDTFVNMFNTLTGFTYRGLSSP